MKFLRILCMFVIIGGTSYRFVREMKKSENPIAMLWYGFEILALAYICNYFS